MTPPDPLPGGSPDRPLQPPMVVGTAGGRDGRPLPPIWTGVGAGWAMVADLMTATFLWGGIGWLLDRWLHTAPWLMSLGFILGNGLGIYVMYVRSSADFVAYPPAGPPGLPGETPAAREGATGAQP